MQSLFATALTSEQKNAARGSRPQRGAAADKLSGGGAWRKKSSHAYRE